MEEKSNLELAVNEAQACKTFGKFNDEVLKDIADRHEVSVDELSEALAKKDIK